MNYRSTVYISLSCCFSELYEYIFKCSMQIKIYIKEKKSAKLKNVFQFMKYLEMERKYFSLRGWRIFFSICHRLGFTLIDWCKIK